MRVDLARHLHRDIVAVFTSAHRPPKRIGILLGASTTVAARLAKPRTHPVLLHRLRHALRTFPHGIECATLAVNRAVGVALAEFALGLAHRLTGAAELIHAVVTLSLLALLVLALLLLKAVLAQLIEQLVEAVAQGLLVLPQVVKLLLAMVKKFAANASGK